MVDNPLWIHDPALVTVCDEYVYALIVSLQRGAEAVEESWRDIAPSDLHSSPRASIPSSPPVNLRQVRSALGDALDDLSWLHRALVSYAEATAVQERARALAWQEPAERVLALWVAAVTGVSVRDALGENPLGHAASGIGAGFPRHHSVVVKDEATYGGRIQPPQTLGDRVARIPSVEAPIRIERYFDAQGQPQSEVYIAGTGDWGVGSSADPFDMQSNVALLAGLSAASMVSVQSAMTRAGIRPGEHVTFTGHSQGGVIAVRLAESGTYRTTGVLVVGAPTGTLTTTGSYPALALRHTDDLVPRLGGSDRGSGFTTIERSSGRPPGDIVGAHAQSGYAQMARDLDASIALQHLPEMPTLSGTAQAQVFSAQRVGG